MDRDDFEERLMRLEKQLGAVRRPDRPQTPVDPDEASMRLRLLELHVDVQKGDR